MFTIICIILFAYTLLGKPTQHLVTRIRDIDWTEKWKKLSASIRKYGEKVGRTAVKPILTFYYAMQTEELSFLDRCLIYGALAYVIIPSDLMPARILGWTGLIDDAAALTFVYNKLEDKITPDVLYHVEDTMNDWFGSEYEVMEAS